MASIKNRPAPKYTQEQKIAIIKASNEMLSDAAEKLVERGVSQDIIDAVNGAIDENKQYAKMNYGANDEDINNARYHGANISEIRAYEDRLRARGLTEESVHRKELATVSTERTSEKPAERRVKGMGLTKSDGTVVSPDEYNAEEGTPEKKRRARKKRETGNTEPTHTKEYVKTIVDEPTKVAEKKEDPIEKKEKTIKKMNEGIPAKKSKKDENTADYGVEQFNLSDIPDYVQYDIIPLPSNGQCYPHKKGRIPVAYLTASDENLIVSPNMYRDGKLLDVILRRKVLDKSINVDDLCAGDRDAIILWLRATAYGDDFPITATNRETGKSYDTVVQLSSLKYKELKLEGDENGCLTYNADNGDVIKFRYLSKAKEDELMKQIAGSNVDFDRFNAIKYLKLARDIAGDMTFTDEERDMINEDFDELDTIITGDATVEEDLSYPSIITDQLVAYTISVNGNADREYIKRYIENLRSGIAYAYRNFITENRPAVDFNITINIPESEGGGSFESFLRLDDGVFINF